MSKPPRVRESRHAGYLPLDELSECEDDAGAEWLSELWLLLELAAGAAWLPLPPPPPPPLPPLPLPPLEWLDAA